MPNLNAVKHGGVLGGAETSEYSAWKNMRARCYNPNNKRFKDYGGRGIVICNRWRNFSTFLSDMGLKPSSAHSLERKDNSMGYNPNNCIWALPSQQMVNRRNTMFINFRGTRTPLAVLACIFSLPTNTLRARILSGWSIDDALSTPLFNTGPNQSSGNKGSQ